MSPQEVFALKGMMGDGPSKWVKSKTPATANKRVDTFAQEGRELSKQHPSGSSWIAKIDCSKHASKIVIR